MDNKNNTVRENLAMKIMLIRDKQIEGKITFVAVRQHLAESPDHK